MYHSGTLDIRYGPMFSSKKLKRVSYQHGVNNLY